jgi:hypothetical protein
MTSTLYSDSSEPYSQAILTFEMVTQYHNLAVDFAEMLSVIRMENEEVDTSEEVDYSLAVLEEVVVHRLFDAWGEDEW